MLVKELISDLVKYGEAIPNEETEIYSGKEVLKMTTYTERVEREGLSIDKNKYYVFIGGYYQGKVVECNDPENAVRIAKQEDAMDTTEIEWGDYVDFGVYGGYYVVNESSDKSMFWITEDKEQRYNSQARGMYIDKCHARKIIEKGNRGVKDMFTSAMYR